MSVIENEQRPTSLPFQIIHDERSPLLPNRDQNTFGASTEINQGKLRQRCSNGASMLINNPNQIPLPGTYS